MSISPIVSATPDIVNIGEKNTAFKEVGEKFEAILWRQFLNASLKPSENGGSLLGGSGPGGSITHGLIIDSLAQAMAQGQSLGFTKMLEESFSHLSINQPQKS